MPRLLPIDRTTAPTNVQELLAGVEDRLGMVPGFVATMAQSQAVAEAYVGFSQALSRGIDSDVAPRADRAHGQSGQSV